ncbi:hypothetical protein EJB05_38402, partial [Eragrostis curvula]
MAALPIGYNTEEHDARGAMHVSYDDLAPGGILGQVLQSPYQGALTVLELLREGNENLVLDSGRRAHRRLAGVARKPARSCCEAVLCGTLHLRLLLLPAGKLQCALKPI